MDSTGRLKKFTSILVGNDGRVEATGTSADLIKRDHLAVRVDGEGKTVLPGFVDASARMLKLGMSFLALDLSNTKSKAEALQEIYRYSAENPSDRWIVGTGWDEVRWRDEDPTSADLDSVLPDRPIWIIHSKGHKGWANSLAMQNAQITVKTKAPSNGEIFRYKNDAPTGILKGSAMKIIQDIIPDSEIFQKEKAINQAIRINITNGVTTVYDWGINAPIWGIYGRMAQDDRLDMRVFTIADARDKNFKLLLKQGPTILIYNQMLSLRGISINADGTIVNRSAWLTDDYSDESSVDKRDFCRSSCLSNIMAKAIAFGFRSIGIHASGDKAIDSALKAFKYIIPYSRDQRQNFRINGIEYARPDQIQTMRKLGIGAVAPVGLMYNTADNVVQALGEQRSVNLYPWRSLLDAGVTLASGTAPLVLSKSPLEYMYALVTREIGGNRWQTEQRLNMREAFYALTLGAATLGGDNSEIGSLEPGKWADMVFLDRDIFAEGPPSILKTKVLETWVAGRPVYKPFSAEPSFINRLDWASNIPPTTERPQKKRKR